MLTALIMPPALIIVKQASLNEEEMKFQMVMLTMKFGR